MNLKKYVFMLMTMFVLMACQPIEETVTQENVKTEESVQEKELEVKVEETQKESEPAKAVVKVPEKVVVKEPVKEKEVPVTGNKKLIPVELISPIDGDTIKVKYEGKEESVRFLLVDTPETKHPRTGVQPFGPEASKFTSKMISSGQVQLEFDIGGRDKYQRLLAYVYVDGVSVQEELLKAGLARVAYIYAPNTKYVDQYQEIQKVAQQKAIGIWSVENYATDSGFVTEEPKKVETTTEKTGCEIKGNINSKGDKIYHMPEQQYYGITNPEEWFCSEQEATTAGFRASQR
jgi:micrococcal nuclease